MQFVYKQRQLIYNYSKEASNNNKNKSSGGGLELQVSRVLKKSNEEYVIDDTYWTNPTNTFQFPCDQIQF